MNKTLRGFIVLSFFFLITLCSPTGASARVEWSFVENIPLESSPLDIAISGDGETTYILCEKKILIYSTRKSMITETIPLEGRFSEIVITPDGQRLLLTDQQGKKISILQVIQIYDIEVGQSPVIGNTAAPVSVFAFLDYQSPSCSKVYPQLDQLLKKYPDEVNLVIKHYPATNNRSAEKASIAALAAARQNKYNELSKLLLKNYKRINDLTIKKYAVEAGVDIRKFIKDCDDPSLKNIVEQDMILGKHVKVQGTPVIFINGRPLNDRSIDDMSQMIEKELKN